MFYEDIIFLNFLIDFYIWIEIWRMAMIVCFLILEGKILFLNIILEFIYMFFKIIENFRNNL